MLQIKAMLFSKTVLEKKKDFLSSNGIESIVDDITIDSPIPYEMNSLIKQFYDYNMEW